jgi:hypothetical protein
VTTLKPIHGSGSAILNSDRTLEIYLIGVKKGRVVFFSPHDELEAFEAESDDKVRRAVTWLAARPSRVMAWFGRVLQSGHAYYVRFEAKIDPFERVLKAMGSARSLRILYSNGIQGDAARQHIKSKLRFQMIRHASWCVLDLLISIAAIALAFIPGPNVFGWYPFLRSLSHFSAFRGARAGLGKVQTEFKCLPELGPLEENLRASTFDRSKVHTIVANLKLSGLEQFLERMI